MSQSGESEHAEYDGGASPTYDYAPIPETPEAQEAAEAEEAAAAPAVPPWPALPLAADAHSLQHDKGATWLQAQASDAHIPGDLIASAAAAMSVELAAAPAASAALPEPAVAVHAAAPEDAPAASAPYALVNGGRHSSSLLPLKRKSEGPVGVEGDPPLAAGGDEARENETHMQLPAEKRSRGDAERHASVSVSPTDIAVAPSPSPPPPLGAPAPLPPIPSPPRSLDLDEWRAPAPIPSHMLADIPDDDDSQMQEETEMEDVSHVQLRPEDLILGLDSPPAPSAAAAAAAVEHPRPFLPDVGRLPPISGAVAAIDDGGAESGCAGAMPLPPPRRPSMRTPAARGRHIPPQLAAPPGFVPVAAAAPPGVGMIGDPQAHEAWQATRMARRQFRFPFVYSVPLARSSFPLALQLIPLDARTRVVPLFPLPSSSHELDTCTRVCIYGRWFDRPLLHASRWVQHGFRAVCQLVAELPELQRELLVAHRSRRWQSHSRPVQPIDVDDDGDLTTGPSASRTAAADARGAPPPDAVDLSLAQLERRFDDASSFFLHLNALVLSPLFQHPSPTPASVWPPHGTSVPRGRMDESERALLVRALNEGSLELFQLARMRGGLAPPEFLLSSPSMSPSTSSFAARIVSASVQFHMQCMGELLWLYDQGMLKYDLRVLRAHREASTHERDPAWQGHIDVDVGDSSSATAPRDHHNDDDDSDSPPYFPSFSLLEFLCEALLALALRHPGICAMPTEDASLQEGRRFKRSRKGRGRGVRQQEGLEEEEEEEELDVMELDPTEHSAGSAAGASSSSGVQFLWHPLLSLWLKLLESTQALDATLLFHPQDSGERLRSMELLWLPDEEESQPGSRRQGALSTAFKQAELQKYLHTLDAMKRPPAPAPSPSSSDVAEPPLSFWIFLRLSVERMLDVEPPRTPAQGGIGSSVAGRSELPPAREERCSSGSGGGGVSFLTQVVRPRELEVALLRTIMQMEGLTLGSSTTDAAVPAAAAGEHDDDHPGLSALSLSPFPPSSDFGVLDRLECLFESLFRCILPSRFCFDAFSTDWARSFSHRMLEPGALLRRQSGAGGMHQHQRQHRAHASQASQVFAGIGVIDEPAARPFHLLAASSPPRTSDSPDATMSPAALLRSMSLHTDWALLALCMGRAESVANEAEWAGMEERRRAQRPQSQLEVSYPCMLLARLLLVQRHSIITARNHAAEGSFLLHSLLQSRRFALSASSAAGSDPPACPPLPNLLPSQSTSSAANPGLHALLVRTLKPGSSTPPPADPFILLLLLLYHLLLRACRPLPYWGQLLGLPNDSPSATGAGVDAVTAEMVASMELRARRMAKSAEQLCVDTLSRMLGEGGGAQGASLILALQPLPLGAVAEVASAATSRYFSNADGATNGKHGSMNDVARSNLLALQRKLSVVLVTCMVLPRQAQEPLVRMLEQWARPVAPVVVPLGISAAGNAAGSAFLPSLIPSSSSSSSVDASSSRSLASRLVLDALLLLVRIRSEWVQLYDDEHVLWTVSQRAKLQHRRMHFSSPAHASAAAQEPLPPLHSFSLLSTSSSALHIPVEYAWLLDFPDVLSLVSACSYGDVLSLVGSLFLRDVWASFLSDEQRRVDPREYRDSLRRSLQLHRELQADQFVPRTVSLTLSSEAHCRGVLDRAVQEAVRLARVQKERETYLCAVMQRLKQTMQGRKDRWTTNDIEVLQMSSATAPEVAVASAPAVLRAPHAPAAGNRPASSMGAPAPRNAAAPPALVDPPRFLTALLLVHGPHQRTPPSLRALALDILACCVPTGRWIPLTARQGAGASLLDDGDDDAFRNVDVNFAPASSSNDTTASSSVSALVVGNGAVPVASASEERQLADARRKEADDLRRGLKRSYGKALSDVLKKSFASPMDASGVLPALLYCNMHDEPLMRAQASEMKQQLEDQMKMMRGSSAVRMLHSDAPVGQHTFASVTINNQREEEARARSNGGSASVSAPLLPDVLSPPLPLHHFPRDGSLQLRALDVLLAVSFVLAAFDPAPTTCWSRMCERWLPRFPSEAASSSKSGVPKLHAFHDVSSPLREALLLRFYGGLIHSKHCPESWSLWPLRHAPQVVLSVWVHAALDLQPQRSHTFMVEFTKRLIEYTAVGAAGTAAVPGVAHAPLSALLPPATRRALLDWCERSNNIMGLSTSAHLGVGSTVALAGDALATFFAERTRVLRMVLHGYALRFSPFPPGWAERTPRRVRADTLSASFASSFGGQNHNSVFSGLLPLLRRGVDSLTGSFTRNRVAVSLAFYQRALAFLYTFLSDLLSLAADCLDVASVSSSGAASTPGAASLPVVHKLIQELMRLEPCGVKHEDMYLASLTALPGVLKGLSLFIPLVQPSSGSSTVADVQGLFGHKPFDGVHLLLLHLWQNYMHLVHEPAHAQRFRQPHGFDNTQPGENFPLFAQRTSGTVERQRLFAAWRKALMLPSPPSAEAAAPTQPADVQLVDRVGRTPQPPHSKSPPSPLSPSPVRLVQQVLLRRYVLGLHVSHALFHAVRAGEGNVRSEWAMEMLKQLVWPLLGRLERRDFVTEFRLLLPPLMALFFQSGEFAKVARPELSPHPPPAAPAAAAAAPHNIWNRGGASTSSGPAQAVSVAQVAPGASAPHGWKLTSGAMKLRTHLLVIFAWLLRQHVPISPYAGSSCLWVDLFGPSPFELDAPVPRPSAQKAAGTILLELMVDSMLLDVRVMLADREENFTSGEKVEVDARRSKVLTNLCTLAHKPHFSCSVQRYHALAELSGTAPAPAPPLLPRHLPRLTELCTPPPSAEVYASERMHLVNAYFAFFEHILGVPVEGTARETPQQRAGARPSSDAAGTAPSTVEHAGVAASLSLASSVQTAPVSTPRSTPMSQRLTPTATAGSQAHTSTPVRCSVPSQQTQASTPTRTPPQNLWEVRAATAAAAVGPLSADSEDRRTPTAPPTPTGTPSAPSGASSTLPLVGPASDASSTPPSLWDAAPVLHADRSSRRWLLHLLTRLRPMMEAPPGATSLPVVYRMARVRYQRLLDTIPHLDPHAAANLSLTLQPTHAQRVVSGFPHAALLNLAL